MHKDKIWAMDLYEKVTKDTDNQGGEFFTSKINVLTGGGDSTLKVWEDFTKEQELLDKQELMQRVQEEQKLSHLIRDQDYLEAAVLAFKLNKVRDFYHILSKLLTKDEQLD